LGTTLSSKVSATASLLALDDAEEDIFILRRLLLRAEVGHPFQPLLSADAFMAWLPTVFAPNSNVGRPLLCFLDIKMPGTNGFDVLRWIRSQDAFEDLPVIMLSSSDDGGDITKAAQLGAQCYLVKYPSSATLAHVVGEAKRYANARASSARAFDQAYNLLLPRDMIARRPISGAPDS
jgi:CheY-like chemotaxis protein